MEFSVLPMNFFIRQYLIYFIDLLYKRTGVYNNEGANLWVLLCAK
jgi:hypothetical protein